MAGVTKSKLILLQAEPEEEPQAGLDRLISESVDDVYAETKAEERTQDEDNLDINPLQEDFFEGEAQQQVSYGEIEGIDIVAPNEESEDNMKTVTKEEEPLEAAALLNIITESSEERNSVANNPYNETNGTENYLAADLDNMSKKLFGPTLSEHEMESREISVEQHDSKDPIITEDEVIENRKGVNWGKSSITSFEPLVLPDEEQHRHSQEEAIEEESEQTFNTEARNYQVPHRQSIFYDMSSRMEAPEQDIEEFLYFEKPDDYLLVDDFVETVEEESEPASFEEEEPALDRTPYYERYDVISEQLGSNRFKNNILQKMVIMCLKRRKVGNIIKDVEPPLDQLIKYGQKLDAYQELLRINDIQRGTASSEVAELSRKRNDKIVELQNLFKAMQSRESGIGYGLIYAKTGNQISDKLVERFIRRQTIGSEQVSSMRLRFLKLKGMVQEKQNVIEQMDYIDNNLHLADYEQLKSENRNYADKIEERDEELTRLRFKCQNTIQILAHMREKSAALDTDLCDLGDDFEIVANTSKDSREHLAELKHTRDEYRQMVKKLEDESGLLTKPHLLRDMEASQAEVELLEIEIMKCQEEVEVKKNSVRKLRRNLERIIESLSRKKLARLRKSVKIEFEKKTKESSGDKAVYRGRPTLFMPTINLNAFDDLVKIRPSPTCKQRR